MSLKTDHEKLLKWYLKNKRTLPWRASKDPYKIWISEVMLQQTTVAAVVPYFERFIARFPDLKSLSQATIEEVYDVWSGLGYYSRARNLHKCARELHEIKMFPQTYIELLKLPGLGPYTARAISSIAFNERVGVVDGNVIRILTRKYGLNYKWWQTKEKKLIQNLSDELAQIGQASEFNQAMMELGATICTPQKVSCTACPWAKSCVAFNEDKVSYYPLRKSKKISEIWIWNVEILKANDQIGLTKNEYSPFLKGTWVPPGSAHKVNTKPSKFDIKHSITHHQIYINLKKVKQSKMKLNYFKISDLKKINPASVLTKILQKSLLLLPFIFLINCIQKPAKEGNVIKLEIKPLEQDAVKLTHEFSLNDPSAKYIDLKGDIHHFKLSSDGQKLIYIATNRPFVKSMQLFEYNLISSKDTRITHQIGNVYSASYISDDKFLFSSDTDIVKDLFKVKNDIFTQSLDKIAPQNIFISNRFGSEIIKLTDDNGFEIDPLFNTLSPEPSFYYVFLNEYKNKGIKLFKLLDKKTTVIKSEKDFDYSSPFISKQSSNLYYVKSNLKSKTSEIETYNLKNNSSNKVKSFDEQILEISHNPQTPFIIISTDSKKAIFWNIEQDCFLNPLNQLVQKYKISQVQISNDLSQIYFIATNDKFKKLYVKKVNLTTLDCNKQFNGDF